MPPEHKHFAHYVIVGENGLRLGSCTLDDYVGKSTYQPLLQCWLPFPTTERACVQTLSEFPQSGAVFAEFPRMVGFILQANLPFLIDTYIVQALVPPSDSSPTCIKKNSTGDTFLTNNKKRGSILYASPHCVFQLVTFLYLADCYSAYASSAQAGQILFRNLMALVFPLLTQQMFATLTYKWAFTLFAILALIMAPTPFIQDTCAQYRLPKYFGSGCASAAFFVVVVVAITSRN
ncbi:hypothetical protein OG21DRAFT_1523982 [Imleria badia]|nr:hypothetical protein OG21DRAFT_1523982 [Imleria badia]